MVLNIFGIDARLLLLLLYNNAKQQGPAYDKMPVSRLLGLKLKPGKLEIAQELLMNRLESDNFYFDYVDLGSGPKPIFVNFGVDEPDFSKYDHHHGIGLSKVIVSTCRRITISDMTLHQKEAEKFGRHEREGILERMIEIDKSEKKSEDLNKSKDKKPRSRI